MKPGRELDALVAEKVMGDYISDREGEPGSWRGPDFTPLPQYSTDISAAWEVVEKIINHSDYVCWELSSEWKGDGAKSDYPFYARFCLGNGDKTAGADTAPHAICIAALKVVGVEV